MLGLVVTLGLSMGFMAQAAAISSSGFTAYPVGKATSTQPYFEYALAAGQQRDDTLVIANTTASVQTVALYPVDAVLTDNGGFGMFAESSPRTDIGSWIQLPVSSLTLAPKETRHISFRIAIPSHVSVGAHYGGIVIQPQAGVTHTTNNASVTIVPRLGVRVYETVPGRAHPDMSLTTQKISRHDNTLEITTLLKNTGNTLLSPRGTMSLHNTLGITTARHAIQAGELFRPGDTITIHSRLPVQANLPQRYTIDTEVTYAPHRTANDRQTYWVAWQAFALFGLAIVGLAGTAVYAYYAPRLRRRR